MNISKMLCLFVLSFGFFYTFPGAAYVDKGNAVVRVMDKAAGKTQIVSLPVNKTVHYDGLTLITRSCKQSDPFDAENHFAFLEIYTKSDNRIFSGWMNRNEPGQNPLQNDAYDVWLEKCE